MCYHLPPLTECRADAAANAGRVDAWPLVANEPARDTPVTRATDRDAVRMWWRWRLALGCVFPDDQCRPGRTDDGPTYEWSPAASASELHGNCAEFCRRHDRIPVEIGAFTSELADLLPAGIPEDQSWGGVDIPPRKECRARFASEIADGPVAWPDRAESGD